MVKCTYTAESGRGLFFNIVIVGRLMKRMGFEFCSDCFEGGANCFTSITSMSRLGFNLKEDNIGSRVEIHEATSPSLIPISSIPGVCFILPAHSLRLPCGEREEKWAFDVEERMKSGSMVLVYCESVHNEV